MSVILHMYVGTLLFGNPKIERPIPPTAGDRGGHEVVRVGRPAID